MIIQPFLKVQSKKTFCAETIFNDAKTAILEGFEDAKKVVILLDAFSKAYDLLKKDTQVTNAVQTEFLRYAGKGKEANFNGFSIKIYDRKSKEDFLSVKDDIVEDYKIILADIEKLTDKKKSCEEYMRQNCDIAVTYTTVTSISSKRSVL